MRAVLGCFQDFAHLLSVFPAARVSQHMLFNSTGRVCIGQTCGSPMLDFPDGLGQQFSLLSRHGDPLLHSVPAVRTHACRAFVKASLLQVQPTLPLLHSLGVFGV